jgi:hypothetical protein
MAQIQSNDKLVELPLTTDAFKFNLNKHLPNHLGRNLALEAEIAVKNLSKDRAFRNDVALAKDITSSSRAEASLIHEELVLWIEEIRKVVLPALSRNLSGASVSSILSNSFAPKVIAANTLNARQIQDDACAALYLTPALTAYIGCIVLELGQFVLRSLARVVERDSSLLEAQPSHLFLAFQEDARCVLVVLYVFI